MTEAPPANDPAALTLFNEKRSHQTHRAQLPGLADLAHKVERVHADDPDVPADPGDLLQKLIGELEVHMKKAELILFPAIRRGGKAGIEVPIAAMRAEHDDHGTDIARIRTLTNNMTRPDGACGSWTRFHDGLAEFEDDFEAHVRLKNEVLFPMFEPAARKTPCHPKPEA